MSYYGEIIALLTVLCWTISVQFFEAASKRVGPTPVNIIRIGVAVILFSFFLLFRDGIIVPTDFPYHAWFYLSLSGVIGFFLGDIFLFKALVQLGPRVAMLIQSLAAPAAAVIGWFFLQEIYLPYQWLGMFIALFGVGIVILEKKPKVDTQKKRKKREITLIGVIYGILGMLGQAAGMVLSKVGMQTDSGYLDAFSATQIRALAAFVCFFILFTVTNRWRNVQTAISDKKAVLYTSLGAAIGPFLGVSLSLMALHFLTTGIASTFFALIPICIIPFSLFLHNEHVTFRAIAGAFIAVYGISLLVN